jgi:hypothetical protein
VFSLEEKTGFTLENDESAALAGIYEELALSGIHIGESV